jgi:hypothetical protein
VGDAGEDKQLAYNYHTAIMKLSYHFAKPPAAQQSPVLKQAMMAIQ